MNQELRNTPQDMGQGYLIVRVSTAKGAIPIVGAKVIIREENASDPIDDRSPVTHVLISDRDGNTPRLALEAPPKGDSFDPYGNIPYKNYSITVEAPGYYRQQYLHVPIFDTITSIQPAVLIPIADNGQADSVTPDEYIVDESETSDLNN